MFAKYGSRDLTGEKRCGMDQDAKRRALDEALKQIEKDFGKGAVMKLGSRAI